MPKARPLRRAKSGRTYPVPRRLIDKIKANARAEAEAKVRAEVAAELNADEARLIRKLKAELAAKRFTGMDCRVCERHFKVEERPLYRMMGLFLRQLDQLAVETDKDWHHYAKVYDALDEQGLLPRDKMGRPRKYTDHSKLRHWRLVEWENNKSGKYRLTERGRAFVRAGIGVPSHVRYRNGNAIKEVGPLVTLDDVLKIERIPRGASPAELSAKRWCATGEQRRRVNKPQPPKRSAPSNSQRWQQLKGAHRGL